MWLKKSRLDGLCGSLAAFDGEDLEVMYDDLLQDPKTFKDDMKSEDGFQMNQNTYFKFKLSLRKLFKTK